MKFSLVLLILFFGAFDAHASRDSDYDDCHDRGNCQKLKDRCDLKRDGVSCSYYAAAIPAIAENKSVAIEYVQRACDLKYREACKELDRFHNREREILSQRKRQDEEFEESYRKQQMQLELKRQELENRVLQLQAENASQRRASESNQALLNSVMLMTTPSPSTPSPRPINVHCQTSSFRAFDGTQIYNTDCN